ncbi:MAG: fatty acid desaturase [Stappiaceae bacterium]
MTARDWARLLAPYGRPQNLRGIAEICFTLLPFIALWAAIGVLVSSGYWVGMLLTIPAAAFLVRLFMIQHDCGHGSFFSSRTANNWTGRALGVLTFTPYFFWKRSHTIHHSGSGSLSRRGFGDINTLTVEEYRGLSKWAQLRYRLYRHPLVMFGVGPGYLFLLDQRLPLGQMRGGWRPWVSTMGTNLSMALLSAVLIWFVGWEVFLLVQLPVTVLAATFGVWLFFVQHQFEDTTWDHDDTWNWHEAALYGSSHYDLPQPLKWFSANIGLHHIHHLSSRIPYYRLSRVIKDYPDLINVNRLTLFESFKCVPLALWDESRRTMVSFAKAGA